MSLGAFYAGQVTMYALETRLPSPNFLSRGFPDRCRASPAPFRRRKLSSSRSHALPAAPIHASSERHAAQIALARSSRRSVLLGLVSTLLLSQCSEQAIAGLIDEQQADKVFEVANPSVVAIADYNTSNSSEISEGTGSGFIWDTYGHVVTNYHCIAKLATDKAGSQV